VPLPESACVYCGNCVEVCPTGALAFTEEYRLREARQGDRSARPAPTPSAPAARRVHAQPARAGQPHRAGHLTHDQFVGRGNLCIKGRFGSTHVQT